MYQNIERGITKFSPFSLGSNSSLDISADLSENGKWDFYLTEFELANDFYTSFDLELAVTLDLLGGAFQFKKDLPSIDLLTTRNFNLAFGEINNAASFSVLVASPIPPSILLFCSGIIILGAFRKYWGATCSNSPRFGSKP